jgi:uncharacterized protein
MSRHRDLVYLGTLLDVARRASATAATVTKEEFDREDRVHFALAYLVRAAAKSAAKVPAHVREEHPEIDWIGLEDLWNVLDEELKTDFERVWHAAREKLPVLVRQLSRFTPNDPADVQPTASSSRLVLEIPHEELAEFCTKWHVRRLAFFGSVVRNDFGPESDVDVLVEFTEGKTPGLEFYGAMPDDFSRIVGGRKVDLVTFNSINRWMRGHVLAEAVTVWDLTPRAFS